MKCLQGATAIIRMSTIRKFTLSCAGNWLLAVFAAVVFGAAWPAYAYVLSGPHVLELVVRTLDRAQSLRIVQNVSVEDDAIASQPLAMTETLSYLFPDRMRSETTSENMQRIQVVAFDQTLNIIDGKRSREPIGRLERYKELLLYRSRSLLHKMLLTHGVDVEKCSLGRFEDSIVWVIGAQYPDESTSQVWVDKESFLPLGWLDISPDNADDRVTFLYRQWQKKGDVWYPLKVEIYRDGKLIRQVEVTSIEANPALPLELFDIPSMTSAYPAAETVAPAGPESVNPADEVKKTIEEFQKKFDE